jgi:hypothetical protein
VERFKRDLLSRPLSVLAIIFILACTTFASRGFANNAFGRQVPTSLTQPRRLSLSHEALGAFTEDFSIQIKDFKMNHQSEINNLNLVIRYRYVAGIPDTKYPDFRSIAKDVENLLTHYPNDSDYWEILNKRLTTMVLKNYPEITSVTCEIQVSPSPLVQYSRSSIVTLNRKSLKLGKHVKPK